MLFAVAVVLLSACAVFTLFNVLNCVGLMYEVCRGASNELWNTNED